MFQFPPFFALKYSCLTLFLCCQAGHRQTRRWWWFGRGQLAHGRPCRYRQYPQHLLYQCKVEHLYPEKKTQIMLWLCIKSVVSNLFFTFDLHPQPLINIICNVPNVEHYCYLTLFISSGWNQSLAKINTKSTFQILGQDQKSAKKKTLMFKVAFVVALKWVNKYVTLLDLWNSALKVYQLKTALADKWNFPNTFILPFSYSNLGHFSTFWMASKYGMKRSVS